MAKKQEQVDKIVENEPVVINEKDIISEEAKAKAEAEKKKTDAVKLRVLIGFTDKYTKQDYAVNDEIYVDKDRAKELLANEKRLVEKLD